MKSWLASIAMHGALAVLGAMLWLLPETHTKAQPMRWTVAFTQPIVAPSREEVPAPPPPAPKKLAQPQPSSPTLAPPPASPPQPAPTPVVVPPPEPVVQVTSSVPAPSASQAVERPAVLAHAAVKAVSVGNAPSLSSTSTVGISGSAHSRSNGPTASTGQTGAGDAEAAAAAAAAAERRWYLVLLERLRAMKNYPPVARRLGQEGVVLIEARISPDGRLENAQVKKGSGYPLLDREALRLLEAAAENARGQLRPDRPANLEIPIAYRLEG